MLFIKNIIFLVVNFIKVALSTFNLSTIKNMLNSLGVNSIFLCHFTFDFKKAFTKIKALQEKVNSLS